MSARNGGNSRWKRQEERIAEALGTSRIVSSGARRSDIEAGQYGIEVKTMKAIPVRVVAAMEQSVGACGKTGKIPVVVLNQPRAGKKALRLVVMRFEDWLDHDGRARGHEGRALVSATGASSVQAARRPKKAAPTIPSERGSLVAMLKNPTPQDVAELAKQLRKVAKTRLER